MMMVMEVLLPLELEPKVHLLKLKKLQGGRGQFGSPRNDAEADANVERA
jgi:hypothetical protein